MAGYKEIADEITREIATGILAPGTSVPSLHTICREFKVSYMTAVHAHEELARRGLVIRNSSFRRTLVGPALPESSGASFSLKKIVLVHDIYPVKKHNRRYSSEVPAIVRVLEKRCRERGLAFESAYNRPVPWREAAKFMKSLSPDTGYVIGGWRSSESGDPLHLSSLLAASNVPVKVFLDHVVPNAHCVVNGYGSCAEGLVRELKRRGVRSVLYLRKSYALSNFYSRARWDACRRACEKEGISMASLDGTDLSPLLDFLRENRKEKGIMCPQDTVADRCRMFLEEHGLEEETLPVITGMDCVSFAERMWPKLSVKFDMTAKAEKAFELAVNSSPSDVIRSIAEIPGKLVLPEVWEKERRKY